MIKPNEQEKVRKISREKIRRLRLYVQQRKAFYNLIHRTLSNIKSFDQLFVIICAILIGIVAGYIAAGFRMLINFFQTTFWGSGNFLDAVSGSPPYLKMLIPAVVLALVAWFVDRFAREAKGHGVPEVMDSIARQNGFMRMRVVLVKALASALSIGSGGAVGREGPIVQIGSAFGSSVGQLFQVSANRMKTFIGCGAAAGIAATFNAPIAGAIFASEIILGDFSFSSIGPIMISSVMGTVISHSIYGDFPAFIPPVYELKAPVELIFYGLLGIGAGLAGWLFVRTLYSTEDFFDKLSIPITVKAFAGGLIIGSIGIIFPQVLGVGYETMDLVLVGKISVYLTAILVLVKILATSVTLGAGGSGGIFAPSLFIGSMLGGTMGSLFHGLFPQLTALPGAYALVGMSAVVAATTHAPITAILIIFEMTGEYTIILPLIISSTIAIVLTTKLLDGSIYTIKLRRRGIEISGGTDINILKQLNVVQIKRQFVETIDQNTLVEELLRRMSTSEQSIFYGCDEQLHFTGAVTQQAIRRFLNRFEEIPEGTRVSDIINSHFPSITDDTPIDEALRLMNEMDTEILPVIDHDCIITGQVARADILREYQEALINIQSTHRMASAMKYVHKYFHEKTEVLPGFLLARIDVPSPFINLSVHKINVRKKYGVDVLLIRRKIQNEFKDFVPIPNEKMKPGDQLLIFGVHEKVVNLMDLK